MDDKTPDNPDDNPDIESGESLPEEVSQAELLKLLERLRIEHRMVDKEINAMLETGVTDMLKIKRMKKVKLAMKDKITFLENQLTPDIIA